MHRNRAYTLVEFLVAGLLLLVFGVVFILATKPSSISESKEKTVERQLHDIHQAMIVFASANNGRLPGVELDGHIVLNSDLTIGSGGGDTAAGRYMLLLNGQFIDAAALVSPLDDNATCGDATHRVTPSNFSYALLAIGGDQTGGGRRYEWRDSANSEAVLMCDRNIGSSFTDSDVASLWTHKPGDWKGYLAWGDGHVDFAESNLGLTTWYHRITQTNDNLFATVASPGVTENSTAPDANAWMVWN